MDEFSPPVPWQEYDCPIQKADTDLEGELMVFNGQQFYCHWCGGNHIAGIEARIDSYNANGDVVETPNTQEELRLFRLDWKATIPTPASASPNPPPSAGNTSAPE